MGRRIEKEQTEGTKEREGSWCGGYPHLGSCGFCIWDFRVEKPTQTHISCPRRSLIQHRICGPRKWVWVFALNLPRTGSEAERVKGREEALMFTTPALGIGTNYKANFTTLKLL